MIGIQRLKNDNRVKLTPSSNNRRRCFICNNRMKDKTSRRGRSRRRCREPCLVVYPTYRWRVQDQVVVFHHNKVKVAPLLRVPLEMATLSMQSNLKHHHLVVSLWVKRSQKIINSKIRSWTTRLYLKAMLTTPSHCHQMAHPFNRSQNSKLAK